MTTRRERIFRAQKGAVIAEFAIAFMPICAMFLGLCELASLEISHLTLMHAAMVSVRACAVSTKPDPGAEKGVDGSEDDYKTAAQVVMKPFVQDMPSELKVDAPACTHQGEPNGGMDTVTLNATFTCKIPLARNFVCLNGPHDISVTAQFPHQGACYLLEEGEAASPDCSEGGGF